jgi:hypothetical protein
VLAELPIIKRIGAFATLCDLGRRHWPIGITQRHGRVRPKEHCKHWVFWLRFAKTHDPK